MSGYVEEEGYVCGETFDHDLQTTYEGEDGRQYMCRTCGAEIWEEPDHD